MKRRCRINGTVGDVYTIRYLYMCLSHSEQIRYAESFLRKKILYDEYVPVDSVICWSENILPTIKTNNRNDENYFCCNCNLPMPIHYEATSASP